LQKAINRGELALPEDKNKPEGGKKTAPATIGMVSSSSNREPISSSQIVAQGGVYLNITHPEVKQRYVDKRDNEKSMQTSMGMPIICMRCACDLASPS